MDDIPLFTGPGSTPLRRRFWNDSRAVVIASQKLPGRNVTTDEHQGKGTIINVAEITERRPPKTNVLYIQYKVNEHNEFQANQSFVIGETGLTHYIQVTRVEEITQGRFQFQYIGSSGSHLLNAATGSFAIDAWHTVDIKLDFSVTPAVATFRLEGVVVGSFLLDHGGLTINLFRLGIVFDGGDDEAKNANLDDLFIGTTDYGSSNLFMADFSSSIVPPFDSITDPDSALSISSGTLKIFNVTATRNAAYAEKALIFP